MPGRPHLSWQLGLVVLLAAALAGCGGTTVQVDRFPVTAAGDRACPEFLRALPRHVSNQVRRPVSGSPYAAAWGDPPIVLRCGVGKPKGLTRFSACQTANGIDWFVPDSAFEDQHADVVMTTLYRKPGVQVYLPAQYRPPVAAMVDLTRTIKQHTTVLGHCR